MPAPSSVAAPVIQSLTMVRTCSHQEKHYSHLEATESEGGKSEYLAPSEVLTDHDRPHEHLHPRSPHQHRARSHSSLPGTLPSRCHNGHLPNAVVPSSDSPWLYYVTMYISHNHPGRRHCFQYLGRQSRWTRLPFQPLRASFGPYASSTPNSRQMSTYPPSGTAAEEYELSPNTSLAGLSTSPRQSTSRQRKLTINPNQSSAALFGVGVPPTRPRGRRRTISNPVLNQVTEEEPGHAFLADDRGQTEEVELPDFGHILGFNEGDDQYTIAASMRSPWKRKLYLLMEEPSSGREAVFIHLLVTGAILFR